MRGTATALHCGRVVTKHHPPCSSERKKDKEVGRIFQWVHTKETLTDLAVWEYSLGKVALVFQPEGQTGAKGEQESFGEEGRNGSNSVSTNVKERTG